jgi:hypothetical protein
MYVFIFWNSIQFLILKLCGGVAAFFFLNDRTLSHLVLGYSGFMKIICTYTHTFMGFLLTVSYLNGKKI